MGWVNDFQPLGKELQQANIASDMAGVWPYTIWIQKKVDSLGITEKLDIHKKESQ